MLVLIQRIGQSIIIGDRLQVEALDVNPERHSISLPIRSGATTGSNRHDQGTIVLNLDETHKPAPDVEVILVDVKRDTTGPKAYIGIIAPHGTPVNRGKV